MNNDNIMNETQIYINCMSYLPFTMKDIYNDTVYMYVI